MRSSDPLPSLLNAVLEDDTAEAKALIATDPELAACQVMDEDHFLPAIAHWIYVGDTALHVAAAGYRVEMARFLLKAGADVASASNRRRSQPLHYASDGHPTSPGWNPVRQVEMIRCLLEAGADIHATDRNGAAPLHRAVRTRCADAVKCLLQAGADPDRRNLTGSTPFHLAVQNTGRGGSGSDESRAAQREIIEVFLKHGASPDLEDASGKTVRACARSEWIRALLDC